jgi:hypothetical protein
MTTRPIDFRAELGHLRDNLTVAIRSSKTSVFKEGLEMYENLFASFTEKMSEWGSPYDRRRAMQEVGSWGGDWSEIRWINEDLREVIDAGVATENPYIIKEIYSLIYRSATTALSKRDYYIFHHFMEWFPYLYEASTRIENQQLRQSLLARSWMLPKEIGDMFVFQEFDRNQSIEELERTKDFAIGIILAFNQLLKRAYNLRNKSDFQVFAGELGSLFHLYSHIRHKFDQRLTQLKIRLLFPHQTTEAKTALEVELELAERRMTIVTGLEDYKSLVMFGFGAWFLNQYESRKITADELKDWLGRIPRPPDIQKAWRLYLDASSEQVTRDIGWEMWAMSESLGAAGPWSGIAKDLELYFLTVGLQIVSDIPSAQRKTVEIPPSPELRAGAERPESHIAQTLTRLERESEIWKPILGEGAIGAIPTLREILLKGAKLQKQREEESLIAAALSQERIATLRQSIIKGWNKNAEVRRLVHKTKAYESGLEPLADSQYLGISLRDRKDFYVEGATFEINRWGEEYGAGLARGENDLVLKALSEAAEAIDATALPQSKVPELLVEKVGQFRQSGYDPVVLALNIWQTEPLQGKLPGITVCQLRFGDSPQIVIVDIQRIGRWRQFKPKPLTEAEVPLGEEFLFLLKPITQEEATEMTVKAPRLRIDSAGAEKPLEEVIRELQLHVHLRIVEQFEYKIIDPNAAIAIKLDRDFNLHGTF